MTQYRKIKYWLTPQQKEKLNDKVERAMYKNIAPVGEKQKMVEIKPKKIWQYKVIDVYKSFSDNRPIAWCEMCCFTDNTITWRGHDYHQLEYFDDCEQFEEWMKNN